MEFPEKRKSPRLAAALIVTVIVCLLIGGAVGYAIASLTSSNQSSDLQNRITNLEAQVSELETAANASIQISDLEERISNIEAQLMELETAINASIQITDIQNRISNLEERISDLESAFNQSSSNVTYTNITYVLGENFSLPQLYEQVKDSVIMVQGTIVQYDLFGRPYYSRVQGSGFVSNMTGRYVIITNYHVVEGATNITITFIDGDTYTANVIGSDPYADLAVLSADAPQSEYIPLVITSSLTLKVGDPVLALGNPYGLAGSITSGIVSALGRTITEDSTEGYAIANCIQTTTAINPGNSGGPLLNYRGEVVGITTAIVSDSQGIGFAIPSSSILRELESLITNGTFNNHPWLGASGTDMSYGIAQVINTNVTYGWLIAQVTTGGPADTAGLRGGTSEVQVDGSLVTIGGDIVIAINGTRIRNWDDLSAYLEEYTSTGRTISVTIIRNNETLTLSVTVGVRPSS